MARQLILIILPMRQTKGIRSSRKRAYIILTPLNPTFTGVYIIFLSLLQHTLWYSLEPPRRGGSNEYPQSMFWEEIWKNIRIFYLNFSFFGCKTFNIFGKACFSNANDSAKEHICAGHMMHTVFTQIIRTSWLFIIVFSVCFLFFLHLY